MFAIKITEDNLEKIKESVSPYEYTIIGIGLYLNSAKDWFLVRGYVDRYGHVINWAVLPAYILAKRFEYNPVVIETDWDQIVRKEEGTK